MTFASLRRYRPAVFLAGDDIDIPLGIRAVRGLVVLFLAWVLANLACLAVNALLGDDPGAEAQELQAFNASAAPEKLAADQTTASILPRLELRGESSPADEVAYRRRAVVLGAGVEKKFVLLEMRRGEPRGLLPAVRPISTPVSIHPVLGYILAHAVEPVGEKAGQGVDEEVAREYVKALQTAYETHLGGDLGWQPGWMRRINGGIQFGTLWLFMAAAIILGARFVCHLLPDRRLPQIDHFDDGEESTPWRRDQEDSQAMLDLYLKAAQDFRRHTSWFGCRTRSPFLELRRFAFAAFLVAENISQIPAFLETKANSLVDRLHASLAMTRYLIWAIPTLGFVGTVVGIGASLERTNDLQSLEPLTVAIAKNAVSTSIGVAFDTTFVALVLSLLAMLVYHTVQGLEEMNVLSRKDETIDALTHLENAKPFRCHASRVADGLERLGFTAEYLERQLAQLPAPPDPPVNESTPPSKHRRLLFGLATLVAIGAVWWLASFPLP